MTAAHGLEQTQKAPAAEQGLSHAEPLISRRAKDVEADITSGFLRGSASDISRLDHDFDGEEGPLDIAWIEAEVTVDFTTGEPLAEDELAPIWYYVFYDPSARPNYAYVMWTIGNDEGRPGPRVTCAPQA